MSTDRLWAPWRLGYVQGQAAGGPAADVRPRGWRTGADEACFLCRAAATDPAHDRDLGVLERTTSSVVLLNRYPYANGHLLVAPLDHRAGLDDLSPQLSLDLQQRLAAWCAVLTRTMQPQGFNIGLNLGRVAGAGVPGHLHWHIVPRWQGDVNFMPVIAGTHVLPQALDSLWEQLSDGRAPAQEAAPPR
jgi:ATP adenylyltransferase